MFRLIGAGLSAVLFLASNGWSQEPQPEPRPMPRQGFFAPRPRPARPPFAFAPSAGSYLGVNVQEIDAARARALKLKEEHGVEITMVAEDSPAAKAGLQKGDAVLSYNGQRVEGTEQFVRLVRETPPERQVKIGVWRGGKAQTLTASVGSRRDGPAMRGPFPGEIVVPEIHLPDFVRPRMSSRSQLLGVEAESVDGQLASFFGVDRGILVRTVIKDSAAEKAGLKAGDVITAINHIPISNPAELSRQLRSQARSGAAGEGADKARPVSLTVVRERKEMDISVSMPEPTASSQSRGSRQGPARRIVQREERF